MRWLAAYSVWWVVTMEVRDTGALPSTPATTTTAATVRGTQYFSNGLQYNYVKVNGYFGVRAVRAFNNSTLQPFNPLPKPGVAEVAGVSVEKLPPQAQAEPPAQAVPVASPVAVAGGAKEAKEVKEAEKAKAQVAPVAAATPPAAAAKAQAAAQPASGGARRSRSLYLWLCLREARAHRRFTSII